MTALELQASKQNLIESILSIDDPEMIEKVIKYVSRIHKSVSKDTTTSSGPLVMTDTEFRKTVIQCTQDFRKGGKVYTQEDMRKIAE